MNDFITLIHLLKIAFYLSAVVIGSSLVIFLAMVARGEIKHRKYMETRAEKAQMRLHKEEEAYAHARDTFDWQVKDLLDEYTRTKAYIHGWNITDDIF